MISFKKKSTINTFEIAGLVCYRNKKFALVKGYNKISTFIEDIKEDFIDLLRHIVGIPVQLLEIIITIIRLFPVIWIEKKE